MNFVESLYKYILGNLNDENDWYNWRKINEAKIPQGISLPKGNQYIKNVALKMKLNEKFKNNDSREIRYELLHYYMVIWGGIKSNSEESLNRYVDSTPEELVNNGVSGIASWSKALCVHNPEKYAIYDARVSISLNALQVINNVDDKKLFPLLPSQNKLISATNRHFNENIIDNNWGVIGNNEFYKEYLALLQLLSVKLKVSIYTIEMFLFSEAETLVLNAFGAFFSKEKPLKIKPKAKKTSTKSYIAEAIYKLHIDKPRKEVLELFQNEAGLTKAGASTYYNNIKKKLVNL